MESPELVPTRLSAEVADTEPNARFSDNSDHFAATTGRVKPKFFEPDRTDNEVSVFRVLSLDDDDVWQLAVRWVEPSRRRRVKARAEIAAAQIRAVGLALEGAEPPPRHAAIRGWPEKAARLSLMQQLAANAKLRVRLD